MIALAYRAGELLLAVALEDPAQVALAVRREDVGSRRPRGLVHAHVERRVLRVREAAVGHIELQRRHAEIEQDAVGRLESGRADRLGDAVVDGVDERHAVAEAGETLAGDAQRILVAVEPDEMDALEALQERLGVPAHAECGVDEDGAVALERRGEQLDAALEQNRGVDVAQVHGRRGRWSLGPDPHPL